MIAKLLDFLDGIYPSVNSRSPFVGKNLLRRVILSGIYHTNNFLCWYYHNIKKKSISSPEEADYVVSLTTYPARVGNVWRVIEMAANQRGIKEKYAICLYLIKSEFEGIDLPAKIKELQARGLTVKFNGKTSNATTSISTLLRIILRKRLLRLMMICSITIIQYQDLSRKIRNIQSVLRTISVPLS